VPELTTSTSSCNVPDTVTVPAEMVKSPVKVFVFDNVKVPAPTLVRLPAPEIIPEISSLPVSPVVNVIPVFSSTAPEPLNELIVSVVSTS
jgi:hypothetical protein